MGTRVSGGREAAGCRYRTMKRGPDSEVEKPAGTCLSAATCYIPQKGVPLEASIAHEAPSVHTGGCRYKGCSASATTP